jgi:hypothetical protein
MSYNGHLTLVLGRRRKIRCKYQSRNESTCIQCAARGSSCLDQWDVAPVNNGKLDDVESISLRERVAVLESMVNRHAQVSQNPVPGLQALELRDEPVEADVRVPFVSMLNNVEVS